MNLALLPLSVCIGACVVCYVIYKLKKRKMKLGDLFITLLNIPAYVG